MEKPIYQELLEKILTTLANNPQEVKVQRIIDEMGVLLRVKIHPQDMGIVIGRNGENIKAIKTIIKALGNKTHARVNIKIEEPTLFDRTAVSKTSTLKSEDIIKELKE